MLMITWAVHRLSGFSKQQRYAKQMMFVLIAALLGWLNALHAHLIYDTPTPIAFLSNLISLIGLVATVVFCRAMRGLCEELGLRRSHASWQVTTALFVLIYLLPLGLFYLAALVAIATQSSFNIDLGPAGLLLIPVFLVPVIHLFISTSRMKNEA